MWTVINIYIGVFGDILGFRTVKISPSVSLDVWQSQMLMLWKGLHHLGSRRRNTDNILIRVPQCVMDILHGVWHTV